MEQYLFISIIINIILFLIIIALVSFKSFKNIITKLVIDAEKLVPGTTGEQKREWVIQQLRNNHWIAKFIRESNITKVINTTVDYFNKFFK